MTKSTHVFITNKELNELIEKAICESLKVDSCRLVDFSHKHRDDLGGGIDVQCILGAERSGQ